MTDSQIYAWILLAIPEGGGKFKDIIALADGINHAIPTHGEMQRSLGWLKHHGFLLKEGRSFYRTDRSAELLSRVGAATASMMETWDAVSAELDPLVGEDAPLDDITTDELTEAYDSYRKEFWKIFRNLR